MLDPPAMPVWPLPRFLQALVWVRQQRALEKLEAPESVSQLRSVFLLRGLLLAGQPEARARIDRREGLLLWRRAHRAVHFVLERLESQSSPPSQALVSSRLLVESS